MNWSNGEPQQNNNVYSLQEHRSPGVELKYEVHRFTPVIHTLLLISSVPFEKVTILKYVQGRCTAPCVRFEPKQETQEDKGTLKTHFMVFLVSNEEFPLFFTGRTKLASVSLTVQCLHDALTKHWH